MSGQFTITVYGQNPIVMDWFGLADPFTQQLPIAITNNWSGTLSIAGALVNPPVWYSGAATSGIQMGAIGSMAQQTLNMQWNINISGNSIQSSSPNTDVLTLLLTAFASGFYTNIIASATLTFSNLLYNRYSGVIKMIGETYNNDQPNFTFSYTTGGNLVSGQVMSYASSYLLSGWESDLGPAFTATLPSGQTSVILNWAVPNEQASQYYIWRWSGSTDLPNQTYLSGDAARTIDLLAIISGKNSITYTDSGATPLQTGFYRNRRWISFTTLAQTGAVISPPYSIGEPVVIQAAKQLFLNRQISGTTLTGPWFFIYHYRYTQPANAPAGVLLQMNSPDSTASGTVIVPFNLAYVKTVANNWYRYGFYVSGSNINTSGYVWFQLQFAGTGAQGVNYLDDTFIVANS